jgi:hypothetical protein
MMTDDRPINAAVDLTLVTPGAPATPVAAAAKLKELEMNREWGERLARGDDATRREFEQLTSLAASGDPLDAIMKGIAPNTVEIDETGGGKVRARDMVTAVADMREKGIPDRMIREVLSDVKPTLEQHQMGKENQRRRFADAEWVERLKAGDPLAAAEFLSNSWAIGCYEPPA